MKELSDKGCCVGQVTGAMAPLLALVLFNCSLKAVLLGYALAFWGGRSGMVEKLSNRWQAGKLMRSS